MIRKTISRVLLLVALFMISIAVKAASDSYVPKKREFRGAWMTMRKRTVHRNVHTEDAADAYLSAR